MTLEPNPHLYSTRKSDLVVTVVPHGFQHHYTIGFSNALARNGVNVSLITSNDFPSERLAPEIMSYSLRYNTSVNRTLYRKTKDFISYYFKLMSFAYNNAGRPLHIIGLLRFELLQGIIQGIFFRLFLNRYILTVHNLQPHDKETKWRKFVYRFVYHIPHYLIVHTTTMSHLLTSSFRIPAQKIIVMQHGINDQIPRPELDKTTCRKHLGIPSNSTVFLFFGRIAPYKGLDVLLQAFESAPPSSFLLIAGKPKSLKYHTQILRSIRQNRNSKRILYISAFIPDNSVHFYFNAADSLVMPYKKIDQSGLLFLAWQFGLPIIATDVGSLSLYIDDVTGILVKKHNPKDLSGALSAFSQNKNKYNPSRIRQNSAKFSWDLVVRPILFTYSKNLSQRKS